jgi:hypothetical protein
MTLSRKCQEPSNSAVIHRKLSISGFVIDGLETLSAIGFGGFLRLW